MCFKLRLVQYFDKKDSASFLELEKKFIALEENSVDMVCGKRFISVMGREPTNTLIWEAEFNSMEKAVECLKNIEESIEHDALLDEQIVYMRDTYVELYKQLN